MLLDRQRAKFWQKIVFGFMAFLMGAFLVVGYSGVLNSCGIGGESSADNPYNEQVTAALDALKASPGSPAAIRAAAEAFQARGFAGADGSQEQRDDLVQAIAYYDELLALSDKKLGSDARQIRIAAIESGRLPVHVKLDDPAGAAADYALLTEMQPRRAEYYLQYGRWASQAGNDRTAYLAYSRYLELEPDSEYAPLVRDELKQIEKRLESGGGDQAPTVQVDGGE